MEKMKLFGSAFYMGLFVILVNISMSIFLKIRLDFGYGLGAGLIAGSLFSILDTMGEQKKKDNEALK